MHRARVLVVALAVAAALSTGMGAYHFFLPTMFGWAAYVQEIPTSIRWALFSINFFFSFLLLAGGILTFVAWLRVRRSVEPDRGVLVAMGGFWLVNVLYQVVLPMPLPASLWVLRVFLFGYAVVALLGYAIALRALGLPLGEARRRTAA